MIILGIETSCDETAISIVEAGGSIEKPLFKLLGSSLMSQIKIHEQYGGVVPNLAKREHIKNLPVVLDKALEEAGLDLSRIDAIAVTVGPGLEPALWTGINFAQDLGKKCNIPIIPTNHMEGHLASVLMKPSDGDLKFPAIGLLISGGHTELVYLKNWSEKQIIGETKDDAVGEAFDKVARMLGLPYPGGPEISKLAEEARSKNIELEVRLPRPMIKSPDLNFSFSGLKTAALYYLKNHSKQKKSFLVEFFQNHKYFPAGKFLFSSRQTAKGSEKFPPATIFPDSNKKLQIAREFEEAVVEVLLSKSQRAIEEYSPKTFIIGGGVIANKYLRGKFEGMINNLGKDISLKIPEMMLTTDNATMIALAGYLSYLSGSYKEIQIIARGNLKYV